MLNSNSFFALYHFLKNDNLCKTINEYKRSQWFSQSQLKQMQFEKLEKIIIHSYKNIPYYRRLYEQLGINPVKKFSVDIFKKTNFLYKQDILKNFSGFFSTITDRKEMKKNSTSGSTGRALNFYNDYKSLMHRQSVVWRNYDWVSCSFADKKVSIWGSSLDVKKGTSLRGRLHSFFLRNLFLSSYYLSDSMMHSYVSQLNRFKPKLLIAYPSHLLLFSEFLEKNNLRIPSIGSIITSGETLYPWQREKIECIFGDCIYDRYGCREFGNIAHQCEERSGYHVNMERFFLEVVDRNGEWVQDGQTGELVITDLDNYGFPFIRYKIGDLGVPFSGICSCGRKLELLKNIVGRSFDIVVSPNGNRLGGTYWTLLMRSVEGIKNFQIVQESSNLLVLRIVKGSTFSDSSLGSILENIYEKCGANINIDVKFVQQISPTPGGKRRFVVSKLHEHVA